MKQLFTFLAIGAMLMPLHAQAPADTVPEVEGDSTFEQVMEEFQARTDKFTSDLEALETQIQDKDITVEDAEARRKEIVKAYQKDVKKMTKPLASEDLLKEFLPKEKDRKENKAGGLYLGLNMSTMIEPYSLQGQPVVTSTPFAHPDIYLNRSREFGFWSQRRLGKSSIWTQYGLNISSVGFDLGENRMVVATDPAGSFDELVVEPITGYSEFGHSTFRASYFELPYSILFNNSNSGEDGLSLSAGLYAGMLCKVEREIQYNTDYGEVNILSEGNVVFVNRWRFGVMAEASFNSLYVRGRLDLSPLFDNNTIDVTVPDVQVMQLGVGLKL